MFLKLFLSCMLVELERNNGIRSLSTTELSCDNYRTVAIRTLCRSHALITYNLAAAVLTYISYKTISLHVPCICLCLIISCFAKSACCFKFTHVISTLTVCTHKLLLAAAELQHTTTRGAFVILKF